MFYSRWNYTRGKNIQTLHLGQIFLVFQLWFIVQKIFKKIIKIALSIPSATGTQVTRF